MPQEGLKACEAMHREDGMRRVKNVVRLRVKIPGTSRMVLDMLLVAYLQCQDPGFIRHDDDGEFAELTVNWDGVGPARPGLHEPQDGI